MLLTHTPSGTASGSCSTYSARQAPRAPTTSSCIGLGLVRLLRTLLTLNRLTSRIFSDMGAMQHSVTKPLIRMPVGARTLTAHKPYLDPGTEQWVWWQYACSKRKQHGCSCLVSITCHRAALFESEPAAVCISVQGYVCVLHRGFTPWRHC